MRIQDVSVHLTTVSGAVYSGILFATMAHRPGEFKVALKQTELLEGKADASYTKGGTFVVESEAFAHLFVPAMENVELKDSAGRQNAGGISTDTEISGNATGNLYGRKLETADSWITPSANVSASMDGNTGEWDQFSVNEKKFGVKNTFDENLYTTKLDRSKMTEKQLRAADKLAKEIERQTSSNFHLNEERGKVWSKDDMDEESRYSSVIREDSGKKSGEFSTKTENNSNITGIGMSRGKDAYVPAGIRNRAVSSPVLRAAHKKSAAPAKAAEPKKPSVPEPPAKISYSAAVGITSPIATEIKSSDTKEKKKPKPAATESESKTTEKPKEKPAPKKATGLNPKAKEFKLSAKASSFTPGGGNAPQQMYQQQQFYGQMPYGAPVPEGWQQQQQYGMDESAYYAQMGYPQQGYMPDPSQGYPMMQFGQGGPVQPPGSPYGGGYPPQEMYNPGYQVIF